MLFSPETVNTVNQVIEMSFEQGTEPCSDSTIEGVLNSVSRMVEVSFFSHYFIHSYKHLNILNYYFRL